MGDGWRVTDDEWRVKDNDGGEGRTGYSEGRGVWEELVVGHENFFVYFRNISLIY